MSSRDFTFFYPATEQIKPAIALSACLVGDKVRYDGEDKILARIDFFKRHFRLLPVCPEVGAGLPVPRPPVQLVQTEQGLRALGRDDPGIDVTQALLSFRQPSLDYLSGQDISGYLFKSRSPSCGLNSTPHFDTHGELIAFNSGIQADYFLQKMPWLVFREETQLLDIKACQDFLWLCKASSECQLARQRQQLAAFHRHYQHYFPALEKNLDPELPPLAYRRQLLALLANQVTSNA